jgi:hypothetical protein
MLKDAPDLSTYHNNFGELVCLCLFFNEECLSLIRRKVSSSHGNLSRDIIPPPSQVPCSAVTSASQNHGIAVLTKIDSLEI